MIFVTDKGRMCNNILQYGHLYAWGREHSVGTVSMRFCYKYPYFSIRHKRWHNPLTYALVKAAVKLKMMPVVEFHQMGSVYRDEQHIMLTNRFVYAWGWCVRFFDLFEKYKDEIRSLFAFRQSIIRHTQATLSAAGRDAVRLGLHIRRGDYRTWSGGHYFFSDEQYAAVVSSFIGWQQGRKVHIFICGNDPELDRDYYRRLFGAENVSFPDGNPAQDLCLLSECDYMIGAPSTFTLVASLYHDTPIYWISDPARPVTADCFAGFDQRHREFDNLFIPS